MSKIKLADGTELQPLNINGNNKCYHQASNLYNGISRDSLGLHFAKADYTFEQLNNIFSDTSKISKIDILYTEMVQGTDAEGEPTNTEVEKADSYTDYTLKISVALESVETVIATASTPAVTEERWVVRLAQVTYLEKQQQLQQEQLDAVLLALVEV